VAIIRTGEETPAAKVETSTEAATISTARSITTADMKEAYAEATAEYLRYMIKLNERLEKEKSALIDVLGMVFKHFSRGIVSSSIQQKAA